MLSVVETEGRENGVSICGIWKRKKIRRGTIDQVGFPPRRMEPPFRPHCYQIRGEKLLPAFFLIIKARRDAVREHHASGENAITSETVLVKSAIGGWRRYKTGRNNSHPIR
jgi:hypothetical protein